MANTYFNVVKDTKGEQLKALARQLKNTGKYVKVGLPDSNHKGSHLTIAQIGMIHEYGAPGAGIPERPFLAVSIKKSEGDIIRLNRVNLKMILNNMTTFDKALEQLGLMAQGMIQAYIPVGDFVPLRPETIARKGSSGPLIDTGQMRQSVSYVVVDK